MTTTDRPMGIEVTQEGPRITIKASCFGCPFEQSESYRVQSDSGSDVYCAHPSFENRQRVGDTIWDTPDFCPVADIPEIRAVVAQQAPVPIASCRVCGGGDITLDPKSSPHGTPDAVREDTGCPPHCCCCSPGKPCCDCGEIIPTPPAKDDAVRLREALERIQARADGWVPKEGFAARISWIEAELDDEPNRPLYRKGDVPPCRNGHEVTELIAEHAGLVARAALSPQNDAPREIRATR